MISLSSTYLFNSAVTNNNFLSIAFFCWEINSFWSFRRSISCFVNDKESFVALHSLSRLLFSSWISVSSRSFWSILLSNYFVFRWSSSSPSIIWLYFSLKRLSVFFFKTSNFSWNSYIWIFFKSDSFLYFFPFSTSISNSYTLILSILFASFWLFNYLFRCSLAY